MSSALLALLLLTLQLPGQTSAQLSQGAGEVIAEVRVHGNYATPDTEVLRLAGVAIGDALQVDTVMQVAKRLRASGRFQQVDVRKRYRSLSDTQQVVLILLVQEHPLASAHAPPVPVLMRPFRRLRGSMQFLPIINYADGYGFTYGLRTSFANALGANSRVSVPLSLGANRRTALEADKSFDRGIVHRLEGGVSASVRENPFYHEDDGRKQIWLRAERNLAGPIKVGGGLGLTHVNFSPGQRSCDVSGEQPTEGGCDANIAPWHDTFATYGADVTLDTRRDPIFPRNAVFARIGWDALNYTGTTITMSAPKPTINRLQTDARGYVGLIGQSVVSVRGRFDTSDGPLPPYEQWLLGGSSSLRGFRTGGFAGDTRALAGVELRVPLSASMKLTRLGLSVFEDSGAVYDHGVRLRDATFHHGAGAGVFLLAPFLQMNLDVAYGFGQGLRVHFTTGFQF
jgi:outer membrane protein assembly factor BamA